MVKDVGEVVITLSYTSLYLWRFAHSSMYSPNYRARIRVNVRKRRKYGKDRKKVC